MIEMIDVACMTSKFSFIDFITGGNGSNIGFHCKVNPIIPKMNKPIPKSIILLSDIIQSISYFQIKQIIVKEVSKF